MKLSKYIVTDVDEMMEIVESRLIGHYDTIHPVYACRKGYTGLIRHFRGGMSPVFYDRGGVLEPGSTGYLTKCRTNNGIYLECTFYTDTKTGTGNSLLISLARRVEHE